MSDKLGQGGTAIASLLRPSPSPGGAAASKDSLVVSSPCGTTTHGEDDTPSLTRDGRLTGAELLALQLHAHGYSSQQVVGLLAPLHPGNRDALVDSAARKLGTADLASAIAEAKRRQLID